MTGKEYTSLEEIHKEQADQQKAYHEKKLEIKEKLRLYVGEEAFYLGGMKVHEKVEVLEKELFSAYQDLNEALDECNKLRAFSLAMESINIMTNLKS